MPANLPPPYHEAEERFRSAVTPEEKIACLEEMLRLMPKHKGTNKLQADLRSRIAKLRRQPKKKGRPRTSKHHIPREGAGQVALVGPANSGKSSLVLRLTHARPEAAQYPFTTRQATPGMMPFEDISFQLIDLPPLSEGYVEHWVYDCIRRADLIWLVIDAEKVLEGIELCEDLLKTKAISMVCGDEDFPDDRRPGWAYKKSLLVLTGIDRPHAAEDVGLLDGLLERPWSKIAVSTRTGEGCDALGQMTFEALGIIRVYGKEPGKPEDRESPFTLPEGSTVGDLAQAIHKTVAHQLKFARIWGAHTFDGQRVPAEHVLEEGDVVEIHN